MFIAIVQIPGGLRSKEDAVRGARKSVPIYSNIPGLLCKYYLNGETGGGGVYFWDRRESAEAWYEGNYFVEMEERIGVKPIVTYYDNYFTLDNAMGRIIIGDDSIGLEEPQST